MDAFISQDDDGNPIYYVNGRSVSRADYYSATQETPPAAAAEPYSGPAPAGWQSNQLDDGSTNVYYDPLTGQLGDPRYPSIYGPDGTVWSAQVSPTGTPGQGTPTPYVDYMTAYNQLQPNWDLVKNQFMNYQGNLYLPKTVLDAIGARQNASGNGFIQNFLNGPGPVLGLAGGVAGLGSGLIGGAGSAAGISDAAIANAVSPTIGSVGTSGLLGLTPAEAAAIGSATPTLSGVGFGAGTGLATGAGLADALSQVPPGTGSALEQAVSGSSGTTTPGYGQLTGPLTTGAEGGLATTAPAELGSLTGPATTTGGAALGLEGGVLPGTAALTGGAGPAVSGFNLLDPSTYSGATSAGTSGLTDWLSKAFPNANMGSVLQGGLQGILGYLGAKEQSNALGEMQDKWLALGAPSRARYEGSFAPGFNLKESDPAVNQMWSDLDKAASAHYGNPALSPSAQGEILGQVWNRGYLPQLNTYRSQNLTGGQLGTNTAGTAGLAQAAQAGGDLNAIGYGLGTAINGQPDYSKLLQQFGLGNNFKLSY